MTWPVPRPGLVIRYSYLWFSEYAAGREEGVKDRPCAVILALRDDEGRTRVFVLPITHAAPDRPVRTRFLEARRSSHAKSVVRPE